MTTPANLLPDAFAGTAEAYARYRPPYPKALLDDLMARAALAPGGRLLDLACGPGRVALALAGAFETVWAIDQEPGMIEVGRREAARRGVSNVTWFIGRAEDLVAAPDAFDLITVGEAFHRLDQGLIARKALEWLKPGGCLATLGNVGILAGAEPWQAAATEVAHRWMARAFPEGWGLAHPDVEAGPRPEQGVLRRVGFEDVVSRDFLEPRDWTFEAIIGYLQSTSVCSRKALGGDFEAFEAELRAALGDPSAAEAFHETQEWGYTFGRKPQDQ